MLKESKLYLCIDTKGNVFWSFYVLPSIRYHRNADISFRFEITTQCQIDSFNGHHAFLTNSAVSYALEKHKTFDKFPMLKLFKKPELGNGVGQWKFSIKDCKLPLSKTLWNIVKDFATLKDYPRW
jgi:hypothetical protein